MKRIGLLIFAAVYVVSTVFFYDGRMPELEVSASDFGIMCISAAYPGLELELGERTDSTGELVTAEIEILKEPEAEEKTAPEVVVSASDVPLVLIVHTHATESYLPASEGNYHTKDVENTVRDVGAVLAETLAAEGIAVVHDQTLHDSPSYNQSYSRSYATITEILKSNPTIQCVIDLHRDAIASDSPAATVSVDGKTCAKYSYVVSTAVPTYSDNLNFVNAMNAAAAQKYSGFTGKVLERGYRYNQDLSSKYMLLEIGYNRNYIEEARNTAEIFGKILAETLKSS